MSQLYGYSTTETHYFIIRFESVGSVTKIDMGTFSEGTGTTLADFILNPNVAFDMRRYLQPTNHNSPFTISSVLRYALNICRAVSFLHSKRMIHRDLTVIYFFTTYYSLTSSLDRECSGNTNQFNFLVHFASNFLCDNSSRSFWCVYIVWCFRRWLIEKFHFSFFFPSEIKEKRLGTLSRL